MGSHAGEPRDDHVFGFGMLARKHGLHTDKPVMERPPPPPRSHRGKRKRSGAWPYLGTAGVVLATTFVACSVVSQQAGRVHDAGSRTNDSPAVAPSVMDSVRAPVVTETKTVTRTVPGPVRTITRTITATPSPRPSPSATASPHPAPTVTVFVTPPAVTVTVTPPWDHK